MKVLIHYNEIGLKGKNLPFFEKTLMTTIRKAFTSATFIKDSKRFIAELSGNRASITGILSRILGISSFSFIETCSNDVEVLKKKAVSMLKKITDKEHFAVAAKRSDKRFPLSSPEVNVMIGDEAHKLGFSIDLTAPTVTLYVEITDKGCYLYSAKEPGLGGLPVGCSGRVLCLLSGGIDSSVAAYMMMKRGCRVDFLHFHNFLDETRVASSKIPKLVEVADRFQSPSKLFLEAYSSYEELTMGRIPAAYDLVVFKNYMLRTADEYCKKKGYKAIITGDSLAQVASQTLDNINATSYLVDSTILRPLIGFDKNEIILLARKIGTFDLSVEKYQDCCSIMAKKAETSVKIEIMKKLLKKIEEK
ncbi:MAG: tRNA 4-thiouridine(8) synthase ThiI [Nanoarchaeota archaeon]|nr:tRNA 4-thiouridine(8) synthase ThiI [Nanoarchaeota archaeon]